MNWNVPGEAVSANWLDLTPKMMLYEYDGPRTFTCEDRAENLYLAHWCDEDQESIRFLVVAFSSALLHSLISGKIDVREALSRPRAWIVDLDHDWTPIRAWRVDVDDLPPGILPAPGVMLWPVFQDNAVRYSAHQHAATVPSVDPD